MTKRTSRRVRLVRGAFNYAERDVPGWRIVYLPGRWRLLLRTSR